MFLLHLHCIRTYSFIERIFVSSFRPRREKKIVATFHSTCRQWIILHRAPLRETMRSVFFLCISLTSDFFTLTKLILIRWCDCHYNDLFIDGDDVMIHSSSYYIKKYHSIWNGMIVFLLESDITSRISYTPAIFVQVKCGMLHTSMTVILWQWWCRWWWIQCNGFNGNIMMRLNEPNFFVCCSSIEYTQHWAITYRADKH